MNLSADLLEQFRPLLRLQVRRLHLDRRLRRRFDSSDVVQDALARAVERADQFRGSTEAEAYRWVQQILKTVALNKVEEAHAQARDFRREVPLGRLLADSSAHVASLLAAPTPPPDERAARLESLARLAGAVERLLPDQQDAVNLRVIQGCPVAEIAALLGKTEKAVAGLLCRGLTALRQAAAVDGDTPP